MLNLFFTVILGEATLLMTLLFKTPVRKLVILGLDRIKRGRGPIVVKSVAGTVFLVLISTLYNVLKIRKRWIDDGDINPTDQVLMAKHLLEACLMGFFLFLALMIDRLHHYIRELRLRRKTMEAVKKNDAKSVGAEEDMKAREEQVSTLRAMIRQLETELKSKTKEADTAEANIEALVRKQSEGLLLEYDHLLAENQELRSQLQSFDQRLPHSPVKKNS
ncbi:hypothetical protein Nepgr_007133 [Nepenthes gracilis]|uniref:Endoplasmic reticulum transmembrane protein n=1 Tax=Nepenthes gracilis TaxID=150966 RepID=A0AAD3XI05_NEPGR|nr:hypothetical protein Nepgr_007133 [Nepenthes gracilis]